MTPNIDLTKLPGYPTAADPFRLACMKALAVCIETVTTNAGYKNDLRGKVFRGRNIFGEKDVLPLVSLLDTPVPEAVNQGSESNPNNNEEWHIIVQGFVKDDLANPTDPAHILFADVRQALAQEKARKGRPPNYLGMQGLVTKIDLGLGTVRPPEAGVSNKAFFWMIVTLGVVEQLGCPYAWIDKQQTGAQQS